MSKDYYREEYRGWVRWIEQQRKNEIAWETLKDFNSEVVEKVIVVLPAAFPEEYCSFTEADWLDFVSYLEHEEENSYPITISELPSDRGTGDRHAAAHAGSAWQGYRKRMLDSGKLSAASVHDIEEAAESVLNYLSDGSESDSKTIHGLVMGNVQSGKTANMEALMSMAADQGINVFIVLSGTIESLRQQTQRRMGRDLCAKNFEWIPLDNPRTTGPYNPSSFLKLGEGERTRYYAVCLKNSARLRSLLGYLNYDVHKKRQMKVLLIDDESDQASLNTKDMSAEVETVERTRINELIMALVNGESTPGGEMRPYAAMNYIAYTATPYGNFLNESGENSLYPRDFITVLRTGDTYVGPQQIFGDADSGRDGLPIIRGITVEGSAEIAAGSSDVEIIERIVEEYDASMGNLADTAPTIPLSLQRAVAWFVVCIAIGRLRGSQRPVTMLVHHSMKTEYHIALAKAIRKWFGKISREDFLELAEDVYEEETERFSRQDFYELWPDYGARSGLTLPDDIADYPRFRELRREIARLKEHPMVHIAIKDDGNRRSFSEGIHICVDNCRYERVADDASNQLPQVRLVYPEEVDTVPTAAPAFLVIGGNTLSRGLTLEGLVVTYFSRPVAQADTLMQMGRWFGYRVGYELLPRIWLTREAEVAFEALTELDSALRTDIYNRYSLGDVTPADCGPYISTCPQLAKLKITAKGKMQAAEVAQMNFAGAHLQTFRFINDTELLQQNIAATDDFIESLGADAIELCEDNHRVWSRVPFSHIHDNYLARVSYILNNQLTLAEFAEWFAQKVDAFDDWNVILQGTSGNARKYHGVGMITRTRRLSGNFGSDSREFSIGSIADPQVWFADIPKAVRYGKDAEEQELLQRLGKRRYGTDASVTKKLNALKEALRKRAGLDSTPRLIIYCIDHEGVMAKTTATRSAINTEVDVIGIEIIVPGKTGGGYATAVTINLGESSK